METLVQQAASLELQQQPQRRFFLEAYFLSLTTA